VTQTQLWVRKPAPLRAIRVTRQNMSDVALWCSSPIDRSGLHPCILVVFKNPAVERRHKAYAGDYILQIGTSFKIYTEKAFLESFEPAPPEVQEDHNYGAVV